MSVSRKCGASVAMIGMCSMCSTCVLMGCCVFSVYFPHLHSQSTHSLVPNIYTQINLYFMYFATMFRNGMHSAALSRHGMRCHCPVLFPCQSHSCFQATLYTMTNGFIAHNGVVASRHSSSTVARDVAAQAVKAREAAADQYDATRIQVCWWEWSSLILFRVRGSGGAWVWSMTTLSYLILCDHLIDGISLPGARGLGTCTQATWHVHWQHRPAWVASLGMHVV